MSNVLLLGDLSFGEPFGSIAEASNEWVTGILDWTIYASMSMHMKQSFFLKVLLPILWGSKLKEMAATAEKYSGMARKKADRRLEMGDSLKRQDFFGHLIKKKEVSADYLMGNAQTLIVAGSETTATGLTSTTFWLLNQPDCLAKLQHEIRSKFKDASEITGDSTAECPYLHGVIEESLRLSPPVSQPQEHSFSLSVSTSLRVLRKRARPVSHRSSLFLTTSETLLLIPNCYRLP